MPNHESGKCCGRASYSGGDGGFAEETTALQYGPDLMIEPIHTRLDLSFDFEAKKMFGTNTITLLCNRSSRTLSLDAISFSSVEVQNVESSAPLLSFRYDGEVITITWAEDLIRGSQYSIAVKYVIENPISGLFFSKPDSTNPTRPFYVATDNETQRARYWMPCVDAPSVRTPFDFYITAPKDLTIVANGLLQSETVTGETKCAHWKESFPLSSYLSCFAVGDLVKVEDGDLHGIPISYYGWKGVSEADLKRSFGKTGAIIAWMEKKLGVAYPFSKQAEVSLITWNDRFLVDETWAKEFQTIVDMVNTHEIAHTYFGDSLVIRHFDQVWLKESWATFMEQQYLKDNVSKEESEYELYLNFQAYVGECGSYKRPLVTRKYESSWDLYDSHTYPGGSCRLHMLEMMLGSETFWAAITKYLKKYANAVVETEDFRKELEAESRMNLIPFFDRWIYGTGYPIVKGSYTHSAEDKSAKVSLKQLQDDLEKKFDANKLFKMNISVQLVVGESKDVPENWKVYTQSIVFDGKSNQAETVFNNVEGKVMDVRIDPQNHYVMALEFNPGLDILSNGVKHNPSVIGRIRSVQELAKICTPQSIRAISEAYSHESFYGVRAQMAKALAKTKSGLVVAPIANMIVSESDPLALGEVILAGHGFIDERIRQAFLKRLPSPQDCKGFPYRSLGRLLHGVGLQHNQADLPILLEYADLPSYTAIVQGGALRGISALVRHHEELHKDAIKYFMRRALPYDSERSEEIYDNSVFQKSNSNVLSDERLRAASLSELGNLGDWVESWKKKTIVSFVKAQLLTERFETAMAAADALISLGAKGAIADVRGLESRVSNMSKPEFRKKVKKLAGSDGAPGDSKKEAEELEKRLQKAEEQIQELQKKLESEKKAE